MINIISHRPAISRSRQNLPPPAVRASPLNLHHRQLFNPQTLQRRQAMLFRPRTHQTHPPQPLPRHPPRTRHEIQKSAHHSPLYPANSPDSSNSSTRLINSLPAASSPLVSAPDGSTPADGPSPRARRCSAAYSSISNSSSTNSYPSNPFASAIRNRLVVPFANSILSAFACFAGSTHGGL